jgi:cytochrome c oxidase subunit 4
MHNIVSTWTYYKVSALLAVLLVITVTAARLDLGPLNVPIALAIAFAKAVLILLYFMHVNYSSPLVKLFAAGGFFWLACILAGILTDVQARLLGW